MEFEELDEEEEGEKASRMVRRVEVPLSGVQLYIYSVSRQRLIRCG